VPTLRDFVERDAYVINKKMYDIFNGDNNAYGRFYPRGNQAGIDGIKERQTEYQDILSIPVRK
jgi:hypothetical protein